MSSDIETTARLENQAIQAMSALVAEHGYDRGDLEGLVDTAMDEQ